MKTYDLSSLVMLETTFSKMLADQAASPSMFSGSAPFTATYEAADSGADCAPTTETTLSIQSRLQGLRLMFDRLPR